MPHEGASKQRSNDRTYFHEFQYHRARRAPNQGVQILRPPLPHRAETSIHPRSHHSQRRCEINSEFAFFTFRAKATSSRISPRIAPCPPNFSYTSRRIIRNCPFAAASASSGSFTRENEYRLPQPAIYKRNQRPLPPSLQLLLRRIRHQRRPMHRRVRQCRPHRPRQMKRIRVREQQPLPASLRGAHRHRLILPHPALRKFPRPQHFQFRYARLKLRQDRAGPVRRLVIHHDHLVNLRLRPDGLDRSRNRRFLISGGNDG